MKRIVFFIAALAALAGSWTAAAQDKTLRVDYIFAGNDRTAEIYVDELRSVDGWYGRRVNMKEVPLRGNGQITMSDAASGDTLYRMSFSTLFQEWQTSEEATRVRKSFENVFQLPMPQAPVNIRVELYDVKGKVVASLTHPVDPSDILIRPFVGQVPEHRYLHKGGDSRECIDVAILSEGYAESERGIFYRDAQIAADEILKYEPFSSYKDRFNMIAVFVPSRDSGISIPKQNLWKDTAVNSSFDTFYSDRYLTTLHLKALNDALAGVPYEHIIVLANTENYGGGGIYNSYDLTAAHHPLYKPVVVHEFGHSFAGLADEYFYDDQYVNYYYPDIEPWEPNITTKFDFSRKWEDMIGKVPGVSLYEGGGYMSKGVWRACEDCRMRTNQNPDFCPVCRRAIENIIRFYTE